jgi:hypothetical protein
MASRRIPRAPNADRPGEPTSGTIPIDQAPAEAAATTEAELAVATSAAPAPQSPAAPAGRGAQVAVRDYVRPAARESPGIIRAHPTSEVASPEAPSAEPVRPAVAPLFSNEGLLQTRTGIGADLKHLLGPAAGAAAAIVGFGTALPHKVGDWWLFSQESRRQPASPKLLALASLLVGLALIVGVLDVFKSIDRASLDSAAGAMTPASSSGGAAGGSRLSTPPASAGSGAETVAGASAAAPSAGSAASARETNPLGPTPAPGATPAPGSTPAPGASTSPGVSMPPAASPDPTPIPTPVSTATPLVTAPPTPMPTATPIPTAAPTPAPTLAPLAVAITQATPPTAHGDDGTFVIESLPGATCTLTAIRTGHGNKYTLEAVAIGASGSSGAVPWGGDHKGTNPPQHAWVAGSYEVKAACRMPAPDGRSANSDPVPVKMP